MELDEFISTTLCQIVAGVKSAQAETSQHGGIVNPSDPSIAGGTFWKTIEFDVAVTTIEGTHKKGQAGIIIAGIGAGGQRSSESGQTVVSRIRFEVPVKLPAGQAT